MKYVIIVVVLLAVLGGGAWFVATRVKAAGASSAAVQQTDKVAYRTIEKIVSANGKVASNRDVDIKCQASGTISKLPFTDVSKEVKPGEMVCQLDPIDMNRLQATAKAVVNADDARLKEATMNWNIAKMALETTRQRDQATLTSAQAHATDAHTKAERTRTLFETKPTALASKEDLDTAETTAAQADADLENAKAAIAELDQQKIQIDTKEQQMKEMEAALAQDQSRLDTADQNVSYCTVTAPLADDPNDPPRWFISSLLTNIAPGYIVQSGTSGFSAGTTIMTLSDLSHVYVLASVDESDIGQVVDPARGAERQKVRITADSFPGQVFDGEVVRVATKGVNTSNVVTFEVKIEVTSPNRTVLRPEMTTTASIVCASRPNVLAIPVSAFMRTQGNKGANAASAGDPAPADSSEHPAAAGASGTDAGGASASAPATTRRGGGRGGHQGGGGGGAGKGPMNGTVTVVKDGGGTETRNVTVGLLGNDSSDPTAGDLFEVISGLDEGDNVVLNKNASDSKWRNQGPNAQQMMRGIGGRGR